MKWVKRNRSPTVRSLCRVLCGCGRRLAGGVLPMGDYSTSRLLPHGPSGPCWLLLLISSYILLLISASPAPSLVSPCASAPTLPRRLPCVFFELPNNSCFLCLIYTWFWVCTAAVHSVCKAVSLVPCTLLHRTRVCGHDVCVCVRLCVCGVSCQVVCSRERKTFSKM